jgi:hypothetical protein
MKPFRLAIPDPREVDLHESCARALDRLLAPPAVWACYPAGHIQLAPAELARLQRAGLKRGWPDLLVLYRQLYGIEVKRHGAGLSKTRIVHTKRGAPRRLIGQDQMFPRLLQAGFGDIAIVHTVDQMLDQIERWNIPLRGRIAA